MKITISYKNTVYTFDVKDKQELLNTIEDKLHLEGLTPKDLGLDDKELNDLPIPLDNNMPTITLPMFTTEFNQTSGKHKIIRPAREEKEQKPEIKRRSNPVENSALLPEKTFELRSAFADQSVSGILRKKPDTWLLDEEANVQRYLENTTAFILDFSCNYSLLSTLLSLCRATLRRLELKSLNAATNVQKNTDVDIESLLRPLQKFPVLEEICIHGLLARTTESAVQQCLPFILRAIPASIKKLLLYDLPFKMAGMQLLSKSLATFPKLEQLLLINIGYEHMTDKETERFMKSLWQLDNLRNLALSGNKLTNKQIEKLSNCLLGLSALEEIVLKATRIDPPAPSMTALLDSFSRCRELRTIDLSNNEWNTSQLKSAIDLLNLYLPRCKKLEHIDLKYLHVADAVISMQSATALAETFSGCRRTIRTIMLSGNRLEDEGVRVLSTHLRQCSRLEAIHLAQVDLTSVSAVNSLVENLLHCPQLRRVDIRSNDITKPYAKALAPLISHGNLTELLVRDVIRSDEDYEILITVLEDNTSITSMGDVNLLFFYPFAHFSEKFQTMNQKIEACLDRNRQLASSRSKAEIVSEYLLSASKNYLPLPSVLTSTIREYVYDDIDVVVVLNSLSRLSTALCRNGIFPYKLRMPPIGDDRFQAVFKTETAAKNAVNTLMLLLPPAVFKENIARSGTTVDIIMTPALVQALLPEPESQPEELDQKREDKGKKTLFFTDDEDGDLTNLLADKARREVAKNKIPAAEPRSGFPVTPLINLGTFSHS